MAKLKGEFQNDNGDVLYPHTSSDVVFGSDGKTVKEQINVLYDGKADYIGMSFIGEDVLSNAKYPRPYFGSANNSESMPNQGQFRVSYIPYAYYNEGYSIQMAYGCVTNKGIWYRKSHGLTWEEWEQVITDTNSIVKGITVNEWATFNGDPSGRAGVFANLYYDSATRDYRYIRDHPSAGGAGLRISIFDDRIRYIKATGVAVKDAVASIDEIELPRLVNRNGIDLNTLVNTGTQGYCTSCTNTPVPQQDGYYIDHYAQYPDIGYQEFRTYNTNERFYRFRLQNLWQPWVKIATTDKIDILFDGSTTTTFNLLKPLVGYDEFKVMGYIESYTHSQFTYNSFTFSKLADGESGYLVFGAGNVQFRCSGTTFTIMHNSNNIKITKLIGIKRGDI